MPDEKELVSACETFLKESGSYTVFEDGSREPMNPSALTAARERINRLSGRASPPRAGANADGVARAEHGRLMEIFRSPEAAIRLDQAKRLAFETDISAGRVIPLLRTMPVKAKPTGFAEAMAALKNPDITGYEGDMFDPDSPRSGADYILSIFQPSALAGGHAHLYQDQEARLAGATDRDMKDLFERNNHD